MANKWCFVFIYTKPHGSFVSVNASEITNLIAKHDFRIGRSPEGARGYLIPKALISSFGKTYFFEESDLLENHTNFTYNIIG